MATYAVSDLHSCGDLWKQIKNYLNENDVLYVLGDSCDRGPDGINVLVELLNRPNTYMIRGNHEQFMYDSIIEYFKDEYPETYYLWLDNGGGPTFSALLDKGENFMLGLAKQIVKMPTRIDYINIKG